MSKKSINLFGARSEKVYKSFLKNILFATTVALFFLGMSEKALAAQCWCELECSAPSGINFSKNDNFSGFIQGGLNSQNNCRDKCNAWADLFIEDWADDYTVCGKLSCNGQSHVGASDKRRTFTKTTTRVCESGPPPPGPQHSQYPAKLVCGVSDQGSPTLVERGQYKTTVNIHNPHDTPVFFRRKVALAGPAQDGVVSAFEYGTIGPDGSQYFHCGYMRQITNVGASILLDGFFVIEADDPLDVTAYYSGRAIQGGLQSLDVETVAERSLPGPMCTAIEDLVGVNGVTIHENTFGNNNDTHNFGIDDPVLTTMMGNLNTGTPDIQGQTGATLNENYDIYFSNRDGIQNNHGSCITVLGQYNKPNGNTGFNIARIQLETNGGPIVFDQIGSFTAGGNGVAASVTNAIDGLTNTTTQLVNSAAPNHTARLTLCTCQ